MLVKGGKFVESLIMSDFGSDQKKSDGQKYYPSLKEFGVFTKRGNTIPVYRQLFADTITPVSALLNISDGDFAFLLESTTGGEKVASRSYLGCNAFMEVFASGSETKIGSNGKVETVECDDPFRVLEARMKETKWVPVDGLSDFSGGAVGYAGYDSVRYFEKLPNPADDDLNLNDMHFVLFDTFLVFDHINKTIKVVAAARTGEGVNNVDAYNDAVKRIDELVEKLQKPIEGVNDDFDSGKEVGIEFASNFKKSDFISAVDRCKEYIKNGDILQVVLSQRFKTETSACPLNIYRALRVVNPSPYMFYLKINGLIMVGSSPEVMVKVENRKVLVRPIAGTRKRGKTGEEDDALAKELQNDPKELAEHIMLLDLGRNDVGRVSKYGTVKIEEKMIIEKYSHVMHITSSVSGILHDNLTAFDAIRACMPAGTLSGAPKIRAMEIIDELEPTKRGPYGGGVGYIDFSGNMNTCITIRTVVLKGKDAYVQAGAGIVADSVPENEYEETVNKAKGILRSIEIAEMMAPLKKD